MVSYRQAAEYWCEPNLSFEADALLGLRPTSMMHLLLRYPVPNTGTPHVFC